MNDHSSLDYLPYAMLIFEAIAFACYHICRRFLRRSLIQFSPAGWLLKAADNLCRKPTGVLIQQMVADMRVEHYDALRERRKFKARWIVLLHYISIARALTIDRLLGALMDYVLGVFRAGKS